MGNCVSRCRRKRTSQSGRLPTKEITLPAKVHSPVRPKLVLNIDNTNLELTPQIASALQTNPHQVYRLEEIILGEGSQSQVYAANHKRTGQRFAIKVTNWAQNRGGQKRTCLHQHLTVRQLEMEVRCLRQVQHPNLLKLHETYNYDNKLYLVTEYLPSHELFQLVEETRNGLPWRHVRHILWQLLQAVQHCHQRGIVHRDISLDNIMVDINCNVCLIDFGLATDQPPPYRDCLGTDYYIAPEVIRKHYTKAADLWSVGICYYCLVTGKPPFNGRNRSQTFRLILEASWNFNQPQWKLYNRSARRLLAGLLAYDPQKRWTADQALASPWFTKH